MAGKRRAHASQFPMRELIPSLVRKLGDYVSETINNIKQKVRNLLIAAVLLISGLFLVGAGIALYLEYLFPNFPDGTFHILLGVIVMLSGIITAFAKKWLHPKNPNGVAIVRT